MTFDPFRPDDAGDDSARYRPKSGSRRARVAVGAVSLLLLALAGAVAVLITHR